MPRIDLSGKVVFITGAAGCIGWAVASALYARGATLVLTDMTQQAVDARAVHLDPQRVLPLALNVVDTAATQAAVDATLARFGRLDIVFANAGIAARTPTTVANMDAQEFEQIVDVNLMGVYRTVKACLPHVVKAQGHVLINASIYAFVNGMLNAPYAISKAGVEMFGRALRAELAGTGATVGVLFPGFTTTSITHAVSGGDTLATAMYRHVFRGPLGKMIKPELVAQAAVDGMERRAPRILVPRLWAPISALRGLLNILTDHALEHDKRLHTMVRQLGARTDD